MNANLRLALVITALVFLWMVSGFISSNKESSENSSEEELFAVQTQVSQAVDFALPIPVRARTEAERSVDVTAQIDGRITSTPVTEGEYVEAGAVLCSLEREDREARASQARAQLEKARIDYDAALKLKDSGFQSRSQIAAAKANLALAQVELERAEIAVLNLDIAAPFSGVVEKRIMDSGDFIQRGMPCATLLELDPIIVSGQVSERAVLNISVGDSATVNFFSGEQRLGLVRYVSRAASDATKSYRIEVEVENADRKLVSGLSAELVIAGSPMKAHLVSPSLLSLLDEGSVGIRSVNSDGIVMVHEVALIGDDDSGVWVTGLPDTINLIVVGQEYVSVGQEVRAVPRAMTTKATDASEDGAAAI